MIKKARIVLVSPKEQKVEVEYLFDGEKIETVKGKNSFVDKDLQKNGLLLYGKVYTLLDGQAFLARLPLYYRGPSVVATIEDEHGNPLRSVLTGDGKLEVRVDAS